MASDDSDVSAITISDDDGPTQKVAPVAKSLPKPATGDAGSSKAAAVTGRKAAAEVAKPTGKGDHGKGKGRVAFRLPEAPAEDDEGDGDYTNGYDDQYADRDADGEGDGMVEDETKPLGWSYFKKRDTSEGPVTWNEVDVGELRFVAENLVRSTTKRASQADDVMQQIFQAAPVNEDDFVTDPLGRGVIDPVSLTLGKRSKMVRAAPAAKGEKGLKATMRTFRTARLSSKQLAVGEGAAAGGSSGGGGAKASGGGAALDEEARKVLPNQEGFDPEAYLANFHLESTTGQLEKGLRSLSRELSERTGQLKLLIRNNFDRFINCKDAIDDIHSKMRKMALVRTGLPASSGGGGGGSAAGASGAGPSAAQQGVGTDRVFRSLEQVETQARRTFGPILDRAAKADRIRAVASLLQRFDHLFAAPQRILELAGRGELEQVVREYKRANMLIRPTPTTARVWVSLYAEIEKGVTEVYLAVKQLVTEPPPEGRPMGQDGPMVLFGVAPADGNAVNSLLLGPKMGAVPGLDGGAGDEEEPGQQRLYQLPDYLLFLALIRQERLAAARDEDAMRLYVSRLETHVEARIQACDKQHTERLGQLVALWMRSTSAGADEGAGTAATAAAGGSSNTKGGGAGGGAGSGAGVGSSHSPRAGIASLQASLSALSRFGSEAGVGTSGKTRGTRKGTEDTGDDDDDDDDDSALDDDLGEEGAAAEASFLLWHGGGGEAGGGGSTSAAAAGASASAGSAFSAFSGSIGGAKLPYHIRIELPRLVQDPGGSSVASTGINRLASSWTLAGGVGGAADGVEPLPSSAHAPEPSLTAVQRQWVSYVCSISALLLWSLPGLWATCNSPKYGNNTDLEDQAREGLERGPSLARRLVESLCGQYGSRLRRAAQSLARAGPMQPGLPLIIKDACHLWSSLRRVGVGSRMLGGLRSAVLAALGAHVGVLEEHLSGLPQLLFGAEDFRLDLLAADQQPVTALPRRLEEEVGLALLHYQWPLQPVLEAAGGTAEDSWKSMQGSVFACFSLLTEALAEYAKGLHSGRSRGGDGRFRNQTMSSPSSSMSSDMDLSASPGGAGEAGANRFNRRSTFGTVASAGGATPTKAGGGGAGGDSLRHPDLHTGSPGALDEGGGMTHGSVWVGISGSNSDDVRMLLVISNSAAIRTRVMPGVVERYRKLLAPTPDAVVTCQRRLRDLTSAMRRSNEALGSKYLGRKEADVQAAVRRYIATATAPLPSTSPAPESAFTAAGGAAAAAAAAARAGASSRRSAKGSRGAQVAVLSGPAGPSGGCCALLQLLTEIHNEALAYSPSNLRSFLEALVERLVGELGPACQALASPGAGTADAAKGSRHSRAGPSLASPSDASSSSEPSAGAGGSVEQLVQLWADLEFLEDALRPLLTKSLTKQLRAAQVALGAAVVSLQSVRRYRPASVPATAVEGLADGDAVSEALRDLLGQDVQAWLLRHALNVRCFASDSPPLPPPAPLAPADATPAAAAAGGNGVVGQGTGTGAASVAGSGAKDKASSKAAEWMAELGVGRSRKAVAAAAGEVPTTASDSPSSRQKSRHRQQQQEPNVESEPVPASRRAGSRVAFGPEPSEVGSLVPSRRPQR